MESVFELCDLVEVKFEDPEKLAELYNEPIAVVKKYLDVLTEIENLKANQKLAKKAVKTLKQELWVLRKCPCKSIRSKSK